MHLHSVVHDNGNLDVYDFFDPAATFSLNAELEASVVNRLKEGNSDRLFMLPRNFK